MGSWPPSGKESSTMYGVGDDYPAYYLSWYNAIVYCNTLSIKENRTPCYKINNSTDPNNWGEIPTASDDTWNNVVCDFTVNGYRLPTEVEWEYAARGGNSLTGTQYSFAGSDTIDDVAWYTDNSAVDGTKVAHIVKTKNPNGLNLYDMTGNLREMCYDWGGQTLDDSTSFSGVTSGTSRVHRGGSFSNNENSSYLYYRSNNWSPENSAYLNGFRVVYTATE